MILLLQCHAVLEIRMVRACSSVEIDVPSGRKHTVQNGLGLA